MAEPVSVAKKFKLRRIVPVQQDVIEENLKPLKENVQKKKRAQEAYYENHNELGVSPLVRDFKRRPVHQRLGLRSLWDYGTNTSAIPPKRKLRTPGFMNQPNMTPQFINQLNMRRNRAFTAQQRINRIRANQRQTLNNYPHMPDSPKRIKLRRTLPQRLGGPANLTVQVKNNNAFVNRHYINQGIMRHKQKLTPDLQQEIKTIQANSQGSGMTIDPMRVTPAATLITTHERFGQLS